MIDQMTNVLLETTIEQCLVCNDKASGSHYGVFSCNGCKTFFRRTITKGLSFCCISSGNCIVDKGDRCACRYCRFQKCLTIGMNINAIQKDREPIGYTKRNVKRNFSATATKKISRKEKEIEIIEERLTVIDKMKERIEEEEENIFILSKKAKFEEKKNDNVQSERGMITNRRETPKRIRLTALSMQMFTFDTRCYLIRSNRLSFSNSLNQTLESPSVLFNEALIEKLTQLETQPRPQLIQRQCTHDQYVQWFNVNFFVTVEWAKSIICFGRLPLSDKKALLRHSFVTQSCLTDCFYSSSSTSITYPDGCYFDESDDQFPSKCLNRLKDLMIERVLIPFRSMRVNEVEFSALRMMHFLNSDAPNLSIASELIIREHRATISNELFENLKSALGKEAAINRFGNLLMLGKIMAKISFEYRHPHIIDDCFVSRKLCTALLELIIGDDQPMVYKSKKVSPF